MNLTSALKAEYDRLWDTCEIRAEKRASAASIADSVVAHRDRYEAAGGPLGIPWYVVGIIHQLEASGDFTKHLHNGDPLTARTVQEPAGRPRTGHPPFTWEFSAKDALVGDGLASWHDWSISGTLFRFERLQRVRLPQAGDQHPSRRTSGASRTTTPRGSTSATTSTTPTPSPRSAGRPSSFACSPIGGSSPAACWSTATGVRQSSR